MSQRTRPCIDTLEPEMTSGEQLMLREIISREAYSGSHLEIGTAAGGTLCSMMSCFVDACRPRFVVVDSMKYFPRQKEIVLDNLTRHGLSTAGVEFREVTSRAAYRAALQRQDSFDFILIDACHRILSVLSDLRWLRLLNVGGTVCIHDYSDKFPGVKLAVDRLLARYNNYQVVTRVDSLLALRKISPSRQPEISAVDSAYGLALVLPLKLERKWKKWNSRKAA